MNQLYGNQPQPAGGSAPTPSPQPRPPQGAAQPAPSTGGTEAQGVPRVAVRRDMPHESPGRLVLPSRQSAFVTMRDISRSGCCIARKGALLLEPGDKVIIEFWRDNIESKDSLTATVRWVRTQEGITKAGLRFLDTSVKTHRIIDQYVRRSLLPGA